MVAVPPNLPDRVYKVLSHLTCRTAFCVAYSGGLDSLVLLHVMSQISRLHPVINVRAVHVNHGLSDQADVWQRHCKHQAALCQVSFSSYKINVTKPPGESLEAWAREQRYAVLADALNPNESLLTAHHAEDQAETVLLQLMRGSGVAGLAAMPKKKQFAQSELVRPLLNVTRAVLLAYATQNNLQWIEDESNLFLHFDRNYIRHQVMPMLTARWPAAVTKLGHSATHCASALETLQAVAQHDLQHVLNSNQSLDIAAFLSYSKSRQYMLFRAWVVQKGGVLPTDRMMDELYGVVLVAGKDKMPELTIGDFKVRRFKGALYLIKPREWALQHYVGEWRLDQTCVLPAELGVLRAVPHQTVGLDTKKIGKTLQVRFRRGGEKIKPAGHAVTHSLKKLMQQWHIPPWRRHEIPLLYFEDKLIAVVGYCFANDFVASPGVEINQLDRV